MCLIGKFNQIEIIINNPPKKKKKKEFFFNHNSKNCSLTEISIYSSQAFNLVQIIYNNIIV